MLKLTDRIYLAASGIHGCNISRAQDCDVYLVDTGDGLVLIDTGVGPDDDAILHALAEEGFDFADVRRILLTHGHADHFGNAAHLHEATGAPVYAHRDCAAYVSDGNLSAIALDEAKRCGAYPADYEFSPCPAEPLEDGEVFTIGDTEWTAISTPGHCSGHMSYLMECGGRRYLFSGDSIFVGGTIILQNIWDCCIQSYAETARRLAALNFDALLPAHFGIDLTNGKRHILKAEAVFDSLGVPPQAY